MPDADHEIILNEKASKIMRLCLLEARMLKAQVADTEHILLAIMKEKDNNACRILEENSIHYTDILNLLTQKAEKSDVQSGFLVFRTRTRRTNMKTNPRRETR